MAGENDNRLYDCREFGALEPWRARTREIEEIGQQLVQPLRLFVDDAEAFGHGLGRGVPSLQDASSAGDAREGVADFVCQACGELTGSVEAFRLFQAFDILLQLHVYVSELL